jgi:hypothetical protein
METAAGGVSCGNEIFIERRIVAWRPFNGNWKNIG